MNECIDTGQLRAYLEGPAALTPEEWAAVQIHLAGCPDCRARLDDLRSLEASVTARVSALAPAGDPRYAHAQPPDVQAALMKMRGRLREEHVARAEAGIAPAETNIVTPNRSKTMQTLARPGLRRAIFSTLTAAALLASLFAFPSLRAAADSLLQTFRAQSVVFLPIQSDRLQQLRDLSTDPTALFLTQPEVVGTPKYMVVGSFEDAAKAVGFKPEQPTTPESAQATREIRVYDPMKAQAQVNVAAVRDVILALGINDVTLPDALGSAPITADVPAFVEATYSGPGYELELVQGRSPTVTLPEGVELAQLGRAGLRVIGMQPEQADELSRQIDWSSTLVVPFPAGVRDVMRVQVGSADGLLVNVYGGRETGPMPHQAAVYWQKADRFYVLTGRGDVTNDTLLLAARSVK
jgi:hypothetical protein